MSASPLVTRRRLVLALVVLVLVAAAVAAATALRPDAGPAAGATPSAGPTASSDAVADARSDPEESGSVAGDDEQTDAASSDGDDGEPGSRTDDESAPDARETLEPRPFDAAATPEPGVTVTVPDVEKVTGEANVPGEVGGPALRFTVELKNDTGRTLDLRTVVVNAYYGTERTPATPLLKPGGKAFASDVDDAETARGVFVFSIPAELQDEVELEIDPRIDAAIVIFTGA